MISYKQKLTHEERLTAFQNIHAKHPDRLPVIVEPFSLSKNTDKLKDSKYLCPKDITLGQFIFSIRKKSNLNDTEALFFFINDKMPHLSQNMSEIYEHEKDNDGFLYIKYSKESAFGC